MAYTTDYRNGPFNDYLIVFKRPDPVSGEFTREFKRINPEQAAKLNGFQSFFVNGEVYQFSLSSILRIEISKPYYD